MLSDPERKAGTSRRLIVEIIRESIELEFEGRINAITLEGSQKFYSDLGFIGKGKIRLTLDAAQKLLKKFG